MESKNYSIAELMKQQFEGRLVTDCRSPAGNWLQITPTKIEHGTVVLEVKIRPEMCNPFGNIHGGMMALLMDECIGWSVVSLGLDTLYTTISLNIDFLYAAQMGETIIAESKIIRSGKKIIHVACEVYNQEKIMLGKCTSNLVVTSMKIQQ